MSFVVGLCKKCGGRPIFNIGVMTRDAVEEWMAERDFGHCVAGWHVEVDKMNKYYEIDWSKQFDTKEEAVIYNNELDERKVAI